MTMEQDVADRIPYARKGENMVCEAGHVVTRPTRDLHWGEVIFGDMLEGLEHLKSGNPAKGIPGDTFPTCSCGELWHWFGAIRFRGGYRVVIGGAPIHLTLREISAGWQDSIAQSAEKAHEALSCP